MKQTIIYEETRVRINDVDMGGDMVYSNTHWFRVGIDAARKKELVHQFFPDYGNCFRYTFKKTGRTKTQEREVA